jgi:hypothetical protein
VQTYGKNGKPEIILVSRRKRPHERRTVRISKEQEAFSQKQHLIVSHPFAEAGNKTLLLIVNVKQENNDLSSKQVKIIVFSVFNISCFL